MTFRVSGECDPPCVIGRPAGVFPSPHAVAPVTAYRLDAGRVFDRDVRIIDKGQTWNRVIRPEPVSNWPLVAQSHRCLLTEFLAVSFYSIDG
jgi:hypothetical protein